MCASLLKNRPVLEKKVTLPDFNVVVHPYFTSNTVFDCACNLLTEQINICEQECDFTTTIEWRRHFIECVYGPGLPEALHESL